MPCRVDEDGSDRNAQLSAKLEKVTQLLCKAGRRLYDLRYGSGPGKSSESDVEEVLTWWRAHRKSDKARAIKEAETSLANLARQIEMIKSAEGMPTQQLLARFKDAQALVDEIAASEETVERELY